MERRWRLLFEPAGLACQVEESLSLLEAARRGGMALRSECGGKGTCGKCKVQVHPTEHLSAPTEQERRLLSPRELAQGTRLACQARPHGPATVKIPDDSRDSSRSFGKETVGGSFTRQPAVTRFFLDGSSPSERDGARDIVGFLARQCDLPSLHGDVQAFRELSRPEVRGEDLTLVVHRIQGLTSVLSGHQRRSLGIALDIGTTTLAAYLCDLNSGQVLAAEASANPQRRFGEDVISRIAYADSDPTSITAIHCAVIEEINKMIGSCLRRASAQAQDVDEVTVAGNPTMEQLFVAYHPHSLGRAPYLPFSLFPGCVRAESVGLDLPGSVNVFLFPLVSGFVGGDTLAVILTDRPHERDETSLIIDIGTNGEIVLAGRHALWATSCATGPAFEGARIACGMRAAPGAIHRVTVEPRTLSARWEVLGETGQKPLGICGSGIIDALAEMRRAGLLLPNGRFNEGLPGVVCDSRGIGREFILVPKAESATGKDITITLADVRQIQLAKAALYSGIFLLMQTAGITHIDRLVLTGAFGARFDWKNAVSIGMLPDLEADVITIENAAGIGAISALLDHRLRNEVQALAGEIRTFEIATAPEFHRVFAAAMTFPD